MRLDRLDIPQVVESVTQALLSLIVRGELREGDVLPSQSALAAQLGVGRNSVREAIQRLVALRAIRVERGRRMVVGRIAEPAGADASLLDSALRRRALSELAEVRSLFEPEVAALAALRASDEDIVGLEGILARMRVSSTPEAALELNLQFHRALANAARNETAAHLLRSLEASFAELYVDLYRRLYSLYPDRDEAGQHSEIMEAARARDPERMRVAMRRHIEESLLNEVSATYPAVEARSSSRLETNR
jgi:GntR family transcriptional repressor for pyruvate dehydrogenase complex